MLANIISQINWVDIVIVFLILRVLYIASKTGFPIEVFKLAGTAAAIYVSLHYYTAVSDLISKQVSESRVPLDFLDFACFVILAWLTYFCFVLLRKVFFMFIKIEAVSTLNKWGGFVLGLARVTLLSGWLVFMMTISTIGYLKESVIVSYTGRSLFKACVTTYDGIWYGLMSKFMTKEKFNKTIHEIAGHINEKGK